MELKPGMIELKPKSTIIITGGPCIGKSTVTRKIMGLISEDFVLAETDVIRNLLRSERSATYKLMREYVEDDKERKQLYGRLEVDALLAGLSDMTYNQLETQTGAMLGNIAGIIGLAHHKNRSIILEGVNLTLGALFRNKDITAAVKNGTACVVNLGTLKESNYRTCYILRHSHQPIDDRKFQNYYDLNCEMIACAKFWEEHLPNVYNIEVGNHSLNKITEDVVEKILEIC